MATSLRLVIAGGGTGGHVQPAVAVYEHLSHSVPVEALWLGTHDGVERAAAERLGIPFATIQTGKFRRYVSIRTPFDALRIPFGILQAIHKLRRFQPDVVFSTGGFVSVPTVVAARKLQIPSLTHEQTATIGLATRINAYYATVVALSFEQSRARLKKGKARVIVTGNPIRSSLFNGSREQGFQRFQLSPTLPLIYITGGSLGAHAINDAIRNSLPELLNVTQIVHQCGAVDGNGDYPRLIAARDAQSAQLQARYVVRERIGDELADLYAAASLVVGRAGAGTVAELAALGKPSLLIPLPGASGDEQTANAHVLANASGAVLLPQTELNPSNLVSEIRQLLRSDQLASMGAAALTCGQLNADGRLAAELLKLARYSTTLSTV